MMPNDIFQMQGELVVLQKELEELEIRGNNSLITIYNVLNPDAISDSITDVDIIKARVEFSSLSELITKAKEVKARTVKIKKRLEAFKSALL